MSQPKFNRMGYYICMRHIKKQDLTSTCYIVYMLPLKSQGGQGGNVALGHVGPPLFK